MTTDLCCGAEVSHWTEGTYMPGFTKPVVCLSTSRPLFMSPDEAERLAELLVKHAREARGK